MSQEESGQILSGYSRLAAFNASDPDEQTSIYRRFDELGARNLLWYQSELVELEAKLRRFDDDDLTATMDAKTCSRDWEKLATRAEDPGNEHERKRMNLVFEIREKLKVYHEALILERKVARMEGPSTRTLETYRNCFHNADAQGKRSIPALGGRSQYVLDAGDLVSLSSSSDHDRLTKFLLRYCPVFFIVRRPDAHSPFAYVSEERLHLFVIVFYIVLSASLLFGAIFNLYYVKDDRQQLGLIAGYTWCSPSLLAC